MSVTDVNDSRPLPVGSLPPADELGGLRTGSHGHGDVRCANGTEQQLWRAGQAPEQWCLDALAIPDSTPGIGFPGSRRPFQ
jgi:hypothetical protein